MTRFHHPLFTAAALLLLQFGFVGGTLAATSRHIVEATSPKTLSLSIADVTGMYGGGFIIQSGVGLGAETGGASLNLEAGRLNGYATTFLREHPAPLMINSGVDVFKSKSFADAAVQRNFKVFSMSTNHKLGVRVATIHGVGDTAFTLSYKLGTQNGQAFQESVVLFARGSYAADIEVIGAGNLDQGKVLSVATKIDHRIANT